MGEDKKDIKKEDNVSKTREDISTVKDKDEMISVKKSKLDELLNRLDRVESAANKAGLARYDKAHPEDEKRIIKLLEYEGKIIKRWNSLLKNKVEKNPLTGVWQEDQEMEITFMDNEKINLPYVVWTRRYSRVPAIIIKETRNRDKNEIDKYGNYTFEVETFEGKKYTIGSNFVN